MPTSGVIEGSDDITDGVIVHFHGERDSKFKSEVTNKERDSTLCQMICYFEMGLQLFAGIFQYSVMFSYIDDFAKCSTVTYCCIKK